MRGNRVGNIGRVFLRDLKRLSKAPAAWSVAIFLCLLPSLYTWFNVAAFWNPYDNTGNLRICVVNEDEGTADDTLGQLNLGDQVVEQLADNNQLAWDFVGRDVAMEAVASGSAYAAFVIPADFSRNVATILSGDFQRPKLEYYVNEKTGPVSPKIVDTGANSLDTSINDAFFSTVSSTVADLLNQRIAESEEALGAKQASAEAKIDNALAAIDDARARLGALMEETSSARAKAADAKSALVTAKASMGDLGASMDEASQLAANVNTDLADFTMRTSSALDDAAVQLVKASTDTTTALTKTVAAIAAAHAAIQSLSDSDGGLDSLITAIVSARDAAENASASMEDRAQGALDAVQQYRADVIANTTPAISSTLAGVASVTGDLKASLTSLQLLVDEATMAIDELDSTLALSTESLAGTDRVLDGLRGDLSTVKADIAALGTSFTLKGLMGDDGIDSGKIADFMMSPTQIVNEELYPVNAYGSAMAPLFMNLTLWIGVFMLMVIVRLEVDDEGIERLTITQRYLGRGIILSLLAMLQAVVCCTGCIILGVQTANVALFYLTAIIASLAYLAVQYTLSSTMQHVGKAFCIVLVFVQIPGATGLYPIEMTPDFFQKVYPLFPFTYGINAIRETIGGFYGMSWAYNIGVLVGFFAVFVAIGALLRPYLANLNRMFAREIEESDIINGESVQMPARRYRMSQVIRALADREEFRAGLDARVKRFMALYPRLKFGALAVGIAVPILSTGLLVSIGIDRVIVLTTWLVWFAMVVTYLIAVEYLRDYLSHMMSLEAMSDDEMRRIYSQRDRYTRVQPVRDGWKMGDDGRAALGDARVDGSGDEAKATLAEAEADADGNEEAADE